MRPLSNPTVIRHRENVGVLLLVTGAILMLVALGTAFVYPALGIVALLASLIIAVTGGRVLGELPDLLTTPDESF